MEDVLMADANKPENDIADASRDPLYVEYRKALISIEKAVHLKDTKTLSLFCRIMNKFRRGFKEEDFIYINEVFMKDIYNFNFGAFNDMTNEAQALSQKFNFPPKFICRIKSIPEIFIYNFLIMVMKLVDKKSYEEAFSSLQFLIVYFKQNENLTIQFLRAKTYYYLSLVSEKLNIVKNIINELHSAYRKSCLEMDDITQVTLINCIVRYYLNHNAVEQARNFLSKTRFLENVSTNEDARHLFYLGRIEAIQMNYSEAYKHLTNSMRKAPEKCGEGFKNMVDQLLIIVQLLMGEIPDIKSLFTQNTTRDLRSLKPYLDLIKVVKQGNLEEFKGIVSKYENVFVRDRNFTLIQRIRHVVIKIGLRKINLSYSRISLKDISQKLKLESEKEAEYIITKAIRDGVFLAKVNHDEGYVQSMEIKDIYSTFEPQKSFQTRIEFLNKIYNDSQKAMKFAGSKEESKMKTVNTELEEEESMDARFEDF